MFDVCEESEIGRRQSSEKEITKEERKKILCWKEWKIIMLSPPATGSCYFPAEMCKILTSEVDYFFVAKYMVEKKLVPCKERMVLWHVQKFKQGKDLP